MRIVPIIILGSLLLAPLPGQPGPPVMLHRLDGPIVLDGHISEPAWLAVTPFQVIESYPNFGDPPAEITVVRVAYDDQNLYVAGHFLARDMSLVRATALERDDLRFSDDLFGILLDTFNDNENALSFVVNPAGNRIDMSVANDAQSQGGGLPWNRSWNTFWDVATTRTDSGWFLEMRIPFSSLRFQDQEGRVVMGLTVWRWMADLNKNATYPPLEPKWDWGNMKPSIAQDVILEGVYASRPLYITPYVLGGGQQEALLNAAGSAYDPVSNPQNNVGLDVKYGLTSNLTLDITLNTDFAQVEADDQQINLTRFSLFFPEKRLFFQERASIFEFSTGGPGRLFHSRRIGLSDYGPVPILAGMRLVGRIGAWDIGLLDMLTAEAGFSVSGDSVTVPAENFTVARIRRQVLNEYSYLGAIITQRNNVSGGMNRALGVDGIFRLWGDDYLRASWSHTASDAFPAGLSLIDASHLRLNISRRSTIGPLYNFSLSRSGSHFVPGMGFQGRSDFYRLGNNVGYGVLAPEESPVLRYRVQLDFVAFYRNADNVLESGRLGASMNLEWKVGGFGNLAIKMNYEDLTDTLWLPEERYVPPGSYPFPELSGRYALPYSWPTRAQFNFTLGRWYDGHRLSFGAGPSWTVSDHIRLSGQYQYTAAEFPEREQAFTVHVARLRLNLNFNAKLSTATFVQLNTAADLVGINFRLRYNPREGTDFYLVYNEGLNLERSGIPIPPLSSSRTILMKYALTFLP